MQLMILRCTKIVQIFNNMGLEYISTELNIIYDIRDETNKVDGKQRKVEGCKMSYNGEAMGDDKNDSTKAFHR